MLKIKWRDVLLNTDIGYSVTRKVNTISFDMVSNAGDHYSTSDGEIYIVSPRIYGEGTTDKDRKFATLLSVAEKIGYTEHQGTTIADLRLYLEKNISRIPELPNSDRSCNYV
jgi:hypothetical protein